MQNYNQQGPSYPADLPPKSGKSALHHRHPGFGAHLLNLKLEPEFSKWLGVYRFTRWGPLVLSRVIRALNWVIRILNQVISPLTTVSIVRGPLPVGLKDLGRVSWSFGGSQRALKG